MNNKDVANLIREKHRYYITPEYWGRIGVMCDRYGHEAVFNALEKLKDDSNNLHHLLSCAEKICQKVDVNDLESIAEDIFEE